MSRKVMLTCPCCRSTTNWEWYYSISDVDNYPTEVKAGQCKMCGTMVHVANTTGKDWYVFIPPDNPWKRKFPKYVHMHKVIKK